MHLLYADESGSLKERKQRCFVLAGFSCFERQSFWLAQKLDEIAARIYPEEPGALEFHGNPMQAGKGFWRSRPKEMRFQWIEDCLKVLADSHPSNRVFASVVDKAAVSPVNPVELSFQELASRFDKYLMRLHFQNDTQRGLIIFDKANIEPAIQKLATDFRTVGHQWGVLRNLAEVPLFLDSQASRLIQLADLIAYAVFRHFERGDSRYFEIIKNRFDSDGGIVHGLFIATATK